MTLHFPIVMKHNYLVLICIRCGDVRTEKSNHNKIHPISPGCPRPSIALQCRIVALKTIHYVHHTQIHIAFIPQAVLFEVQVR